MNNSLQTDDELAQIIWDFNVAIDSVERVDLILVLGSNDIRVAQRGAQLFKEGFGSRLMFSGNVGKFTEHWLKSEAETFAHEAVHMGVPKDKIIIENESTNTGENIVFSQKKLRRKGKL